MFIEVGQKAKRQSLVSHANASSAFFFALALLLLAAPQVAAQNRVSETVHNLSATGPGPIRAQSESRVCIFCHAPHNTGGVAPLWNRELPMSSYRIYQSSTLDALPGQPTGSSKLCLSCHDGTIALGDVISRAQRIAMLGGEVLPAGPSNLGTDLSDDHPISFFYTNAVASADQQLASPSALPPEIKLDASGQMQCTSCHDAHHNLYGQFLVMQPEFGTLCVACHKMNGWDSASHRLATAAVGGSTAADWPFATVAENACRSCHRPHSAGGHERLLRTEVEEDNCLVCHDGQIAKTNIRSEVEKFSAHDPTRYLGRHDPAESLGTMTPHVECSDCHNPHAASPMQPQTDYTSIGPTLLGAAGVTIGGAEIERAQNEYEVCLRCHGDAAVPVPGTIMRQSHTDNLRLEFAATNASFHPIAFSSPSVDTPSLVPTMTRGAQIRCTDCHNNDTGPRAGGGGPDGPHGSNNEFLLERRYETIDDNAESATEYALCYKCHQRSSILGDQSFPLHREHIVEERTPCSACHDPHGVSGAVSSVSDRTHLINFDLTIVRPEPGSGKLEFRDRGRFAGSCTLTCHGEEHENESYGRRP